MFIFVNSLKNFLTYLVDIILPLHNASTEMHVNTHRKVPFSLAAWLPFQLHKTSSPFSCISSEFFKVLRLQGCWFWKTVSSFSLDIFSSLSTFFEAAWFLRRLRRGLPTSVSSTRPSCLH